MRKAENSQKYAIMREYMQNKATGEPYKRSIRKSDQRFCGCIFLSCDVRHGGAGLFRRSDVGEIIPDRAQRDGCGDIQNGVLLHKDGGNADKKCRGGRGDAPAALGEDGRIPESEKRRHRADDMQ